MESLFENKTEYSKELYDEYIEFHNKKYGFKEILYFVIAVIFFIMFAILTISNFIKGYRRFQWEFIGILILGLLILVAYKKQIQKFKQQYEKVEKSTKTENIVIYSFFERYFTTSYHGKNDRIYYIDIKKAFELKDRYYFYIDNRHAFILLKANFTKGSEKDFIEFINKKIRFKIKKVKEKKVKENK